MARQDPEPFLVWNPVAREAGEGWEPRWEIWVELEENHHPEAQNFRARTDRYFTERGCWARKLQSWEHEDGSFAPVDARLVRALKMADTWSRGRFYEEQVDEPYRRNQRERSERLARGAAAAASYYDRWDSPVIGPHTSGDWRHRIR